jgi:carbohydrate kinase (thermoresistant glucokinase family)
LKRSYRDFLRAKAGLPLLFVHLHGEKAVIAERIARRHHEYMPASLLDSQFATLEMPAPDENVLTMSILDSVETIARKVAKSLTHLKSFKRGQ